ncbi:hypothetical protein BFP72_04095 [Reichenbachiella sp. 5M10]|uniref:DUF4249 domain-containing protein n=1 Tax=Reichenbachiella sp. 5M10 TaxID=1889772 RepID=UPI000C15483A|nr:DUF4249 domain-containing protein [Reichenbachiella sp. 5M10]PIB34648.1 hypothetical protein BFP72_04095 [Reichenbachiella sp. 5M10]
MKRTLYIVLILSGAMACVEPFDFTVQDTEEFIVVEGLLTNAKTHHRVHLSKSYSIEGGESKSVSGATVWVEDGQSKKYTFDETNVAGEYLSMQEFAGVPGEQYTLRVITPEGDELQSSAEILPVPVAIDSIYGRYMEQNSTEDDRYQKGIQFMVDNHNASEQFSSYRFEYVEDYEIKVPYPSIYEWDVVADTLVLRSVAIGTCYNFRVSNQLLTETTSGLSENRLSEYPIVYVEDYEAPLRSRYSLTVRQFAITSGAYQYYKSLKENNESSGSFFDKQKGTVVGNVKHVDDPGYTVLGYFEVSGVSENYRIFTAGEFRQQGFSTTATYFDCIYAQEVDSVALTDLRSLVGGELGYSKEVIGLTYPIPDTALLMPKECSDCRLKGTLDKPDFWD